MGMDVTVAAPRESTLARMLAGSARLLELPGKAPSRSPADFIRDLAWISGLIETGEFDILHASRATGHLLTALANRKRVPLLHLRGGAKKPYGHPGNRLLYRWLTDRVIVSSSRVEEWVTHGLKVPPDRVHRILAPVDVRQFKPASPEPTIRAELGIADNAKLIVKVARLAPVKGHDLLLEAMTAVHHEFPLTVLVLVGNPWAGQPDRLMERARELGIGDAVIFTGRRDDIQRFLAEASVCVSSSIGSEENSRAVGEYMACARPVVATTVGVIPELVVEGETGILVPPCDPSALAEALLTILRNPERGRRMGEEGRKRAVEEFSEEAFGRRLSRIIFSLKK